MRGHKSPEAIPRVTLRHMRVLEERRRYLLAREADPDISPAKLSYVKDERRALEVALAELRVVYAARVAAGEIQFGEEEDDPA